MSRAAIWVIGNARVRAAASSMASGSPSSRAQMSAMTPSWSSASSIGAARGRRAGEEESDGVVGRQRRHRPDGLAADPQPLAARGEEPQARAATQQVLGHLGGSGDDVLAVVEHDQPGPGRRSARRAGSGPAGRGRRRSPRERRPGSPTGASSTRHPPKLRPSAAARPTSRASRVLPTPPGPTSVTKRWSANSALRSRTSASRPTSGVSASGMPGCDGRAGRRGGDGRRAGGVSAGRARGSPTPAGAAPAPVRGRAPHPGADGPPGRPAARRPAARPRYSASISSPRNPSRSGWAATSSSSWTTARW